MASYFDFDTSMQAAMWALFLVAFFSFLCKSNLVVDRKSFSSIKVLRGRDLVFTPHGATLSVRKPKQLSSLSARYLFLYPLFPVRCSAQSQLYTLIYV